MRPGRAAVIVGAALAAGASWGLVSRADPSGLEAQAAARPAVIPWPASVELHPVDRLTLTADMAIEVGPGHPDLRRVADGFAALLRPALDKALPVREAASASDAKVIRLEVVQGQEAEGYELRIGPEGVRVTWSTPAGVFYGLQTLRQLLPASVDWRAARPHAVSVPAGRVVDRPRYQWRGAMLDVARHFFDVAAVQRYIDLLALHKFNRLHLHLSDDQGWRIAIAGWPNLTAHGGSTAVGGGPGGFYTQADYSAIVEYARDRFITIVPEIDMPGHVNAALASYPELNCDGKAPRLYTGIDVGFSAFCAEKDVTWRFIDDVVREIAAMTPGPYFHIGGDEVKTLTPAQYNRFVERVQPIVEKYGKQAIGWDEVTHATLRPSTIVQYWRPDASITPAPGTRLILSPANKVYLDMKYDAATVPGLNWAGFVDVRAPYDWDPAGLLEGVDPASVLGVEAPIWSETLATTADIEYMAFPRLAAVAEVAWSPQARREWTEFRGRLGAQARRWSALDINAYWSPAIDWER